MIDNTKYEFNNNGILTSPVQAKVRMGNELYNYAIELCHKLDMKVFKEIYVTEPWSNCSAFYTKSEYHKLSTESKYIQGLALTYNGFINAVIWVKDINGKPTYFYNAGSNTLLEKGNRHVIRSVNLRQLIRKILDKGYDRKPIKDEEVIDSSHLIGYITKLITNMDTLKRDYEYIDLNGEHLHTALELAIGKDNRTTHGCSADTQNKLHDTLDKLKRRWDKIEEAKKKIQDNLSQPFYMICHGMLHEENECVVVKCVEDFKTHENSAKVLDMQYCKDIEDYKDYDLIIGLLTVYKVSEEEKARGRTRVDGFIDVERYNDYYNPDAKIGHLRKTTAKEDSYSSNVERLFILNMQ